MWDEKQFVEDFVGEADRIMPDAEFANRLKRQVTEENLSKLNDNNGKIKYAKYIAIAAALILCIGIGKIGFDRNVKQNFLNVKKHAGKEIQKNENEESLEKEQKQVIAILEDPTIMVDDVYGNVISEEKRKELLQVIKNVKKLENEQLQEDFWEKGERYYCVGEQIITLTVVQDEYVKIDEMEFGSKE